MHFAEIVLPLNLKGTFTYRVPAELGDAVLPGMRVLVPFGGKKIYTGLVFSVHQKSPENFLPKDIISILDDSPILPPQQIKFWEWLSEYYLTVPGEIYRFAFPGSLKLESETYLKIKPYAQIDLEVLDSNEMLLIQALEVKQMVNLTEMEAFIPKKELIKTINALIDLQYIEVDEHISEKYRPKEVAYVRLVQPENLKERLSEMLLELKRSPRQKELLLTVLEHQTERPEEPLRKSHLLQDGQFAAAHLKPLISKGYLEEYQLQQDRLAQYEGELETAENLTELQQKAKTEIDSYFSEKKNVLLHGVTSSGKTHIYLEKIEDTVSEGKSALVLLPEIALTKQLVRRLEKQYGGKLGFYHQKLSDYERVEVWRKVRDNNLQVILGTRSALFLPFQNLGLVVIDEEHDFAFRPKEVTPFFSARDAAMMLAECYNARAILGSATPSVETVWLARQEKLGYVQLPERFGSVAQPEFEIINFKEQQDTKKTTGNFSLNTVAVLIETVRDKKQAIVLHNRRGYASVIECETCGYVNYCSNCDVVLTYHKYSNEMKCHYCGQTASKPVHCPKCFSENLNERGVGVEQIYEEVKSLLPEAEVDRMDVDSMRKKFAYEKLYENLESGETDIVVGTQMMSKGLDFPNIELVIVPKADSLMYIQDFRAEERAYQLLMQVAGRAGRVSGAGKVLIQTYNPQHPVFQLIKQENSADIYDYFLAERQKFNYPPFVRTVLIELRHRKEDKVQKSAAFLASVLLKYLPPACIFGPEKSPVGKINLLYHYQILLKLPRGKKYKTFKNFVTQSLEELNEISAYTSVKKHIFVDF